MLPYVAVVMIVLFVAATFAIDIASIHVARSELRTATDAAAKAAVEALSENGSIVNVSSLSAVTGFFGQANYATAKAGVMTFTKVLSKELARKNIRVNAVAPGVVNTEMGESIPEENRKYMMTQIPLSRFAEPSEISDVILFLCSDLSSYVTGQTIHVNGGWWA